MGLNGSRLISNLHPKLTRAFHQTQGSKAGLRNNKAGTRPRIGDLWRAPPHCAAGVFTDDPQLLRLEAGSEVLLEPF
jgi:hypothetical protein